MNQEGPVGLMIDLRERMVRIETKLDVQAASAVALTKVVEENTKDITDLKAAVAEARTSVRTLKYAGGAVLTAVTLFGQTVFGLFTS